MRKYVPARMSYRQRPNRNLPRLLFARFIPPEPPPLSLLPPIAPYDKLHSQGHPVSSLQKVVLRQQSALCELSPTDPVLESCVPTHLSPSVGNTFPHIPNDAPDTFPLQNDFDNRTFIAKYNLPFFTQMTPDRYKQPHYQIVAFQGAPEFSCRLLYTSFFPP